MLNSGCGLCLEVGRDITGRALFIRVERIGDDIVVKDCLSPYIVATEDTDTSWIWGHYFEQFEDAVEFMYKDN